MKCLVCGNDMVEYDEGWECLVCGGCGLRCDGDYWKDVELENRLMKMELDGEVE